MEFFRRLFVDVKAIQARCINERSSSEARSPGLAASGKRKWSLLSKNKKIFSGICRTPSSLIAYFGWIRVEENKFRRLGNGAIIFTWVRIIIIAVTECCYVCLWLKWEAVFFNALKNNNKMSILSLLDFLNYKYQITQCWLNIGSVAIYIYNFLWAEVTRERINLVCRFL